MKCILKTGNIYKIWNNKPLYIYTIFFLTMIFIFLNKKNLFVDEWLSYSLANGQGINVNFDEGYTYTSIEQIWLENLAVNNSWGGAKV